MGYNISKETFVAGVRREWTRLKRSALAFCVTLVLARFHFYLEYELQPHTMQVLLMMIVVGLSTFIVGAYTFVALLRSLFSLMILFERRYG